MARLQRGRAHRMRLRYRPFQALAIATLAALVTACAAFAPLYDRAMRQALTDITVEEPTAATEGARYSYTPELGIFHAVIGVHGDLMIPEDRLKAAVVKAALGESTLELEVDKLLGKPWDDELESFRHAGDGAPVRWLHHVG